jgi:hypothetical protein
MDCVGRRRSPLLREVMGPWDASHGSVTRPCKRFQPTVERIIFANSSAKLVATRMAEPGYWLAKTAEQ